MSEPPRVRQPPKRQAPREPGKRTRAWAAVDTRRPTTGERGYDGRWDVYSRQYRRQHPLCVPCLLVGRVRAVACVDHIVPRHSVPELFWEAKNHCSMCRSCHSRKSRLEPQGEWRPRMDRIVVCGLPGCGKTTFAKASGWPYWDADQHEELSTIEQLVAARDAWIERQSGACVVIVASPMMASVLASRLCGLVRHLTERWVEREPHALWHAA